MLSLAVNPANGPVPVKGSIIHVQPSKQAIRKLAYERWEYRNKGRLKYPDLKIPGTPEQDWYYAEGIATREAVINSYPKNLKHAQDNISSLVSEAEKASFKICNACGKPGTVESARGLLIQTLILAAGYEGSAPRCCKKVIADNHTSRNYIEAV